MKLSLLPTSLITSLLIAALTFFWSSAIMDSFPSMIIDPMDMTALSADLLAQAMRFFVVIVVLAVIGYLVWKNWSRNFLWMTFAAIIYVLLFHLRYAVLAKQVYSFSSGLGKSGILGFTASTTLISLAIPWWVLFTYLGVFKMEPRRAAEIAFEFIFAVLILLALPIGWSFALYGPLIGWTLPDTPSMFLGFLCILQAEVVSAVGIILSGATFLMARNQSTAQPASASSKRRK